MSYDYDNTKGKDFWKTINSGQSYKMPKTKLRVTLPAGEKIKFLNLAEINAPAGVTMVLNLPFAMGEEGINKLFETVRASGGTVEVINR